LKSIVGSSTWRAPQSARIYSIRTRIALIFGISSLLLALGLSVIVSQTTRRQLEREAGTALSELAFQMADKLDRGMFERYRDIQIVSSLDQFQNSTATPAQQKILLEKLQATYTDYAWIGLTDANGKVLVSTGGLLEGQSVANRPWFMAAKNAPFVGDVHEAVLLDKLLPPLAADAEPRRFVDVAVPIFNSDGSLRNVLGAHLSWNWAREVENSLLQALQKQNDRSQIEMFVLSSPDTAGQRKLILAPRYFTAAPSPGTPMPTLVSSQPSDLSRLAETIFQSPNRYQSEVRWPSDMGANETAATYLTGVARADGYRDYRGLDWLVLVRQPTEQAFALGVDLQWQILGWGIFLGVFFAFIGWLLAGQISRPLLALAQAANQLRLRQPTATETDKNSLLNMPLPTLTGKDELAVVSRSLNNLVSNLMEREQELSSLNARLDEQIAALREREAQLLVEIEERGKAEQALVSSQEQLRQSQKMEAIGLLAGGIAHDFNNILTIILNLCELMLLDLPQTADVKNEDLHLQLREIQQAAYRATALTRQLLIFSRRQVVQTSLLDLNAIIGEMSKMLERLLGEDLQLQTGLANDLPKVKADPGQIEQIIMNLAVNARDAMPQGGRLLIETGTAELNEPTATGSYVMLRISDTGSGMDAATKTRIFEPFFTTKEPGKGTGLGLATVYGIVKQSGGFIGVDSEPGQGTSFRIYLPPTTERPPSTEFRIVIPPATPRRGSEKILVVEDQPQLRSLIRRVLQREGYQVQEATSGKHALELVAAPDARFDLVLTDVIMPEMTGLEFGQRLAERNPTLPVLYMSGYTDRTLSAMQILEVGQIFLEKPFTPAQLVSKVRAALDTQNTAPNLESGAVDSV
jgi:signal transduction histidine kinase/ActR/RegA family two-component response regulator